MLGRHTLALSGRLQGQLHELQLVDLVGELEDEDLVEGEALGCTAFVIEELHKSIGELMPQLALPQIFELEHETLQLFGSLVPLLGEEVGNGVDVHRGRSECSLDYEACNVVLRIVRRYKSPWCTVGEVSSGEEYRGSKSKC